MPNCGESHMKKSCIGKFKLFIIAVFGASLVAIADPVFTPAHLVQRLHIKLTVQKQENFTDDTITDTFTAKTLTLRTKDIIKRIGRDLGRDFPPRASLALVDFNQVQVLDKNKNVIAEVPSFFNRGDNRVLAGKFDAGTPNLSIERHGTIWHISTISFSTFEFSLTGFTRESFFLSPADTNSTRRLKDSIVLTGSGTGYIDNSFCVVKGKVWCAGKGFYPFESE